LFKDKQSPVSVVLAVGGLMALAACQWHTKAVCESLPLSPKGRFGNENCLSASCHADKKNPKYTHGPPREGSCNECHQKKDRKHPSGTGSDFPLRSSQLRDLCFSCHGELCEKVQAARSVHTPVFNSQCISCHEPHGSYSPNLFRNIVWVPEGVYPPYIDATRLCWECHDQRAILDEQSALSTGFRDGDLNLHSKHLSRKKGWECSACHDAHSAPQEALMRTSVPFGTKWELPIQFKRTSVGGNCVVGCHSERSYTRD